MTGQGPRPLAAAVATAARPVLDRHRKVLAALMLHWPAVIGEELAAATAPEKLSRGTKGAPGTLTVRVTPGRAMELQHRAPSVIERINLFLGSQTVDRLRLVQGPLPGGVGAAPARLPPLSAADSRQVAAAVAGIESPELRAALAGLGAALTAAGKRDRG